jgi:class 3 adenylate cyclase
MICAACGEETSVRSATAIGDTVNTASRSEQLTKEYPFKALLSDDTPLLTVPADDLNPIGDVVTGGLAAPAVLCGLGAA